MVKVEMVRYPLRFPLHPRASFTSWRLYRGPPTGNSGTGKGRHRFTPGFLRSPGVKAGLAGAKYFWAQRIKPVCDTNYSSLFLAAALVVILENDDLGILPTELDHRVHFGVKLFDRQGDGVDLLDKFGPDQSGKFVAART